MFNLFLHEVRIRRGATIGWTLGLGFFALVYMSFYPALPPEMLNLPIEEVEIYRSLGVTSMATFEGYLISTVFNFLPLLAGVFGIVIGVGALAGEEESGTLELLASLPLSRVQIVLAKAAAMAFNALLVVLLVGLSLVVVFIALQDQINTSVTALDLFIVSISHWLIIVVFMTLSLFLGAYLPNRLTALAASTVALLFSFFGNNLAGLVEALEPVQPFLPFYYFDRIIEMLVDEADWVGALAIIAMAVLFLLLAVVSFQRRNITVGAWPWQRPKPAA